MGVTALSMMIGSTPGLCKLTWNETDNGTCRESRDLNGEVGTWRGILVERKAWGMELCR